MPHLRHKKIEEGVVWNIEKAINQMVMELLLVGTTSEKEKLVRKLFRYNKKYPKEINR